MPWPRGVAMQFKVVRGGMHRIALDGSKCGTRPLVGKGAKSLTVVYVVGSAPDNTESTHAVSCGLVQSTGSANFFKTVPLASMI